MAVTEFKIWANIHLEHERLSSIVIVRHVPGRLLYSTGSISVSGQLPTYPSPNPTLTMTCYQ